MSEQHGDGIVSAVKSAGKAIGGVIRFTASGLKKLSKYLSSKGIPLSKQAEYLGKLAKSAKYEKSSKFLMSASKALKQSGRGKAKDDEDLIQLADPTANEPSDGDNIAQLADPTANLEGKPRFANMVGGGRVEPGNAPARAWDPASQGNVIAVTSDAMPRFA